MHAVQDVADRALLTATYANLSKIGEKSASAAGDNTILGKLWAKLRMGSLFNHLIDGLYADDPIATISTIGHTMITSGVGLVGGYMAAKAALYGARAWKGSIVGKVLGIFTLGGDAGVVGSAVGWVEAAAPYVLMTVIGLFVVGFTFGYYVPAIPFILFTSAAIGFAILVIEALIAAPLWCASLVLEGSAPEHGRAEQGAKLLLGIMIRPPLMVAGLLLSIVMMSAIGNVIGVLCKTFVFSQGTPGPIDCIAYVFLIGGFLMVVVHKVFGLTSYLSMMVIRWIGGDAQALGEDKDEDKTRQIFGGVATRSENAGRETGGALAKKLGKGKGGGPGTVGDGAGGGKGNSAKDEADSIR